MNKIAQKLMNSVKETATTQNFERSIAFEKRVAERLNGYTKEWSLMYDSDQPLHTSTFGYEASLSAIESVAVNDLRLMREKAAVGFDYDLMLQVCDLFANPMKAVRVDPISGSTPTVTPVQ